MSVPMSHPASSTSTTNSSNAIDHSAATITTTITAPPATTREHRDARALFREKLEEFTVRPDPEDGRPYISTRRLREWLQAPASTDQEGTNGPLIQNVELLLQSSKRGAPDGRFGPTLAMITNTYKPCLIVFSILFEMDQGQLLDKFRSSGIHDKALPMSLSDLLDKVPGMGLLPNQVDWAKRIAEQFDSLQWKYCPLKFEFQEYLRVPWQRIVPIVARLHINQKGGTSRIFQIAVQEEFVDSRLQEAVPNSRYVDTDFGPCYHFALKRYSARNAELFDNERNAFQGLADNPGMITNVFNYSHVQMESEKQSLAPTKSGVHHDTHNLILVYGENDLAQHLQEYSQPVLEDERLTFYREFFALADAIRNIHLLEYGHGVNRTEYFGWHADIKPDNILFVDHAFKLCDPGFARFHQRPEGDACVTGVTRLLDGTTTYGAPEFYAIRNGNHQDLVNSTVSQEIDIWSLGCVFSYTATWMVLGWKGVIAFQTLRENAIEALVKRHESQPDECPVRLTKGDYFHNGRGVLSEVRQWHRLLRRAAQRNDVITGRLLDLIDNSMLLESGRISAEKLCAELRDILDDCSTAHVEELPAAIRLAFTETETRSEALDKRLTNELDERSKNFIELTMHLNDIHSGLQVSQHNPLSPGAEVQPPLSRALNNIDRLSQLSGLRRSTNVTKDGRIRNSKRDLHRSLLRTASQRTSHRSAAVRRKPVPSQPPTVPSIPVEDREPFPSVEETDTSTTMPQAATESATGTTLQEPSSVVSRSPEPDATSDATFRHESSSYARFRSSITNSVQSLRERHSLSSTMKNMTLKDMGNNFSNIVGARSRGDQRLVRTYGRDRDLAFLVDDGASMNQYWGSATNLLMQLVEKAKNSTSYGMELRFSCEPTAKYIANVNDPTRFQKSMLEHRPVTGKGTNMSQVVGELLDSYLRDYKECMRNNVSKRKLTVIILTDGLWTSMQDSFAVDNKIIEFSGALRELRGNGLTEDERRVSLQFVQFGYDSAALKRLERLDDDLKYSGVPDIVDHRTSATDEANLYDILLGSLDESIDLNNLSNDSTPQLVSDGTPSPGQIAETERRQGRTERSASPEYFSSKQRQHSIDEIMKTPPLGGLIE